MSTRRLASVPDAPRRAGFYVRVSDVAGREGERFISPELQLDAVTRYAAARGLTHVTTWRDIDVTGRTFETAFLDFVYKSTQIGIERFETRPTGPISMIGSLGISQRLAMLGAECT